MNAPAPAPHRPGLRRRNGLVAGAVLGVVVGMVGLSFAAVPLYRWFCQVTGFDGTPSTAITAERARPTVAGERQITIRFNANTNRNLPWRFEVMQQEMVLRVGEEGLGFYAATNQASGPVTGVATYNVTPLKAAQYFHKVACFCFDEQTLQPGERVDMPVAFWVDPRIATDPATRDVETITLSYTFFRTLEDAERAGALALAGPHVGGANGRGAPGARQAR
ncbi:MAG: cytochrome c oxidase assembly protein [Alphaproteobacteria bacterium]|nr:cytochrome c oxidase assembly protein [Alphaproteobacteria bacterium]